MESEFDHIVSNKDRVKDLIINQLKLQVHDIIEEDENLTTNFEHVNNDEVINKAYLDEKLNKNKWSLIFIRKTTTKIKYLATNSLWKRF